MKANEIITPSPTWNILDSTKLKCFTSCPRQFFYEYILGWQPEIPSNHLVFGSAIHKALEYISINGYTKENIEPAYQSFLKEYREVFPPASDQIFAPKTPENARIMLELYMNHYKNDFRTYDFLFVEIAGTISIADDANIAFKMDSIVNKRNTGKKRSLERKTGSSPWGWTDQWDLAVANGTYTHVLYCLYPPSEVDGVVFDGLIFKKSMKGWKQLQEGSSLSVQPPYEFIRYPAFKNQDQMNTWLWNVLYQYDQVYYHLDLLMNSCNQDENTLRAFPMNPENCFQYGHTCDYNPYCLAWQNPLTRLEQIPAGFVSRFWNPLEEETNHVFEFGKGDYNKRREVLFRKFCYRDYEIKFRSFKDVKERIV